MPAITDEQLKIFTDHFPGGRLSEIKLNELSPAVLAFFEQKSSQHMTSDEYRAGNFSHFFLIRQTNGDKTYLAIQTKIYPSGHDTEELVYLADTRRRKIIGHAEMRYRIAEDNEYFRDKPFISYTQTHKHYVKQGRATRRIFIFHAMSWILYELPLYSDTLNSPDMQNIWRGLVKTGQAEKFPEGDHDRYVMIS